MINHVFFLSFLFIIRFYTCAEKLSSPFLSFRRIIMFSMFWQLFEPSSSKWWSMWQKIEFIIHLCKLFSNEKIEILLFLCIFMSLLSLFCFYEYLSPFSPFFPFFYCFIVNRYYIPHCCASKIIYCFQYCLHEAIYFIHISLCHVLLNSFVVQMNDDEYLLCFRRQRQFYWILFDWKYLFITTMTICIHIYTKTHVFVLFIYFTSIAVVYAILSARLLLLWIWLLFN